MRERDLVAASGKRNIETKKSTSGERFDGMLSKSNNCLDDGGNKRSKRNSSMQAVKKSKPPMTAANNFLGIGAAKAKAARTARKAAMVGFDRKSKKAKLSNSGSGIPFNQVIRFRYQKGFTQAVRTPVLSKDIL